MIITATLKNSLNQNDVIVVTNGTQKQLSLPPKATGQGSAVNGGELLFLALATCFCNDLYREAVRRNIVIQSAEVTVTGEFGGEGEPAQNIKYSIVIKSEAPQADVTALVQAVDRVAEIHNTLRKGVSVTLDMTTGI